MLGQLFATGFGCISLTNIYTYSSGYVQNPWNNDVEDLQQYSGYAGGSKQIASLQPIP